MTIANQSPFVITTPTLSGSIEKQGYEYVNRSSQWQFSTGSMIKAYPEPVMANCGHDVRRGPFRRAKVGKSFGSRRLVVLMCCGVDGEVDGELLLVNAALDTDGEIGPDTQGTAIDTLDDSLSEAARPVPAVFLGEFGWDETVLSDLDRSCRRWAEERWTTLGDRLLGKTGILSGAVNGGGSGADGTEGSSLFSLEPENRLGEMFKLATLLLTYCCNALKKLILLLVFCFVVSQFQIDLVDPD